ncbi:hypothetical protein M3Y98_00553900 [Aphelenchoides besseyi]|nr:hypothetical protein M3Y98_00553900 [Aphelenchoides besseyi]KAI6194127.1 hypothetical protein M3Y96_01091800 [Aphelenchoides besseyi]
MVRTRSQDKALDDKENLPNKSSRKLASPRKKKTIPAVKWERSKVKDQTDEVAEFRSFMQRCINEEVHLCSELHKSLASIRCPQGPIFLQLRGCVVDTRHQLQRTCQLIGLKYYFAGNRKEAASVFVEEVKKSTKNVQNNEEMDDDMIDDGCMSPCCLIHVVWNTSKKFLLSLLELLLDEQFPAIVLIYCNESDYFQLPPGLSYRLKSTCLSFGEVVPTLSNVLLSLIRYYGTEKKLMFAPKVLNFVCRQFVYHQLSFISVENLIGRVIAEFQENESKWKNAIVKLDSDFDFAGYFDALIVFAHFTKRIEESQNGSVLKNPILDCYVQLQNEEWWSKKMKSAKEKWENGNKSSWLAFYHSLEADQMISAESKAILRQFQKEVEQIEVEDWSEQIKKQITSKVSKRAPLKNNKKWTKGIIEKLEQFIEERLQIKFDFDAHISRLLEVSVTLNEEAEEMDEEIRQYIEQGAIV